MRGTVQARKAIRGSIGYPTLKGDPGEDGYSPQASVTKNGNTATITIRDKNGTTTAQITDGAKGDNGRTPEITANRTGDTTTIYSDSTPIAEIHDGTPGQDGDPGQDGVSPSATVTQTSSGATITITDKTGTTTATVTNGQDGDDGYSPRASVSKSGRVATITVTDKAGTTTAQVSDGQDGASVIIDATPTEDSPNAVSSGGVYDELTDLKSDLRQTSEAVSKATRMVDSNATGTSVDITDPQGYVIARFSDGHIKTKNFDSSEIADDIDGKLDANQGSANVGKLLGIASNGDVVPQSISLPTNTPSMSPTDAQSTFDITDNAGNVLLRFDNGNLQTKNFDSALANNGFEWKFSGTDLLIAYGYNDTYDVVVVMNEGRANGLFDFSSLRLKSKGTPLKDLDTSDLTVVWNSSTDMHGPFQFLATQNADGYHSDATSAGFTGGNHTLDSLGSNFKTATSKFVHYYADGVPVSQGYGKANNFEVRWANDVQAYNTVKQGGGGRSCLTEYHDMIFDGVKFSEKITLVPSEEIAMKLWYGLQCVSIGTAYTNIAFIDATNRQIFASSASNIKSGNAITSGLEAWGESHRIEMDVDTNIDLGKRTYYSGDSGAFVSSGGKGYFYIIGQSVTMYANTKYRLNGSYRFMSA